MVRSLMSQPDGGSLTLDWRPARCAGPGRFVDRSECASGSGPGEQRWRARHYRPSMRTPRVLRVAGPKAAVLRESGRRPAGRGPFQAKAKAKKRAPAAGQGSGGDLRTRPTRKVRQIGHGRSDPADRHKFRAVAKKIMNGAGHLPALVPGRERDLRRLWVKWLRCYTFAARRGRFDAFRVPQMPRILMC